MRLLFKNKSSKHLKYFNQFFYLFITDEKKCNNSLAMNFFFEQGKGRTFENAVTVVPLIHAPVIQFLVGVGNNHRALKHSVLLGPFRRRSFCIDNRKKKKSLNEYCYSIHIVPHLKNIESILTQPRVGLRVVVT